MTHAFNPIFLLSEWVEELEDLFHLFGVYEFLPQPGVNTLFNTSVKYLAF